MFRITSILVCYLVVGLCATLLLPSAQRPNDSNLAQPVTSAVEQDYKGGSEYPDILAQYHRDIRSTVDGRYEYPMGYRLNEFIKAQATAKSTAIMATATERGPGNVGGRTRPILIDPQDSTKAWWAGSVGGGLWKTVNGGRTWKPVTDRLPVLSVSCLAMARNNQNVIYMGTGEGFGNTDAIGGNGIFRSENRGVTWTHLNSTANNEQFRYVNRLLIDPSNADVVLAATNRGIFRSTDGGTAWSTVYSAKSTGDNPEFVAVQDLRAQPGRFSRQIAGANPVGVLVSSDAGLNWTRADSLVRGTKRVERVEVAYARSKPTVAYAAAEGFDTSTQTAVSLLFRSDDGGTSWVAVTDVSSTQRNWLFVQGWYDNTLAVHPYRADTLFLGGIQLWRATLTKTSDVIVKGPSELKHSGSESWLDFETFGESARRGSVSYMDADAIDVTPSDYASIEIRFGQGTQRAHRFRVSGTAGTQGNGGSGIPFSQYNYGGYVEVPFQVWDTDSNRQLMVSFRDQADDGKFDLVELSTSTQAGTRDTQSREYLFIHKYPYSDDAPHENIARHGGLRHGMLYHLWPTLAPSATWDPAALPNQTLSVTFSTQATYTMLIDDDGIDPSRQVHVDHHSIEILPRNKAKERFWILNANDGGIALSKDQGLTFAELDSTTSGYITSQFYGVAKRPKESEYIGGTQDNGTWMSNPDAENKLEWKHEEVIRGDGFETLWHAREPLKLMGTVQFTGIYRSVDGGTTWTESMTGNRNGGFFITSIANSDKKPDSVYTVKEDGVWYSRDFGGTWTSVPITEKWGDWDGAKVRVSIADPNVVWAGQGMSKNHSLYVSKDAGEAFRISNNLPEDDSPEALISGLATHPTSAGAAYALFSVHGKPKVLETRNFGRSWQDLSGFVGSADNQSSNGFPDVAVHDFLVMPEDAAHMWAGTDIGLFESIDAGGSWQYSSYGMPPVAIWRMKARDDQVVLATHGRGVWTIPIPDPPIRCVQKPPKVIHDSLTYIEKPEEPVVISLEATAFCEDQIETVQVYYRYDLAPLEVLDLAATGGGQYSDTLAPIPENTLELIYHLEVLSKLGLTTLLPAGAPQNTYRTTVACHPSSPLIFHVEPETIVPDSNIALLIDALPRCQAPAVSADLFYQFDGASFSKLSLAEEGTDSFKGEVSVPKTAKTMSYYFEATAENGEVAHFPQGAPDTTITLTISRDETGPDIAYESLTHVATEDWPPSIAATVTDTSSITDVWVSFEHERPGDVREPGEDFSLAAAGDDQFAGTFPSLSVNVGDRIHYRIWAKDASPEQNVASLPPDSVAAFLTEIIRKGILASYDFEGDAGFADSSGVWQRATPTYGLGIAHSGTHAWVTSTDAPYPSERGINMLMTPSINLSRFQGVWLEFWYWHDFEHQNITEPVRSPQGTALDGGTVRISTDDGNSWQVLPLEAGYTTVLDELQDNPLAGDSVFAGFSYGWRRALAPLPQEADVRIRFDMGTGPGNSASATYNYAGWVLDDVRVLTARPQDDQPPVFSSTPELSVSILPGPVPPIAVTLTDSTGVADVLADYKLTETSGMVSHGTARLAMDSQSLTNFSVSLPVTLDRGDHVAYRLTARDFDGNETSLPADFDAAFTISANRHEADVIAQATISGLWESLPGGGYAATGTGTEEVSSILSQPFTLPRTALDVILHVQHSYRLDTSGGNLKASVNGGTTWDIIEPSRSYETTYNPGAGHAMDGEPSFGDSLSGESTFDLSPFAGRTVNLRIDLGTSGGLAQNESWQIDSGIVAYATRTEKSAIADKVELHSNYPDPFQGRTTISYTLSEPLPVRIEIYNVLGQRVKMLFSGEQGPATYMLQLDMSGFAGGIYLLRLSVGHDQKVEPLILIQ